MPNTIRTRSLEHRIFDVVIIATVTYLIINLGFELQSDGIWSTQFVVYSIVLMFCLPYLYLQLKGRTTTTHINIFALFILGAFIYYMPLSSGPTAGLGYTFENLIVILILMTQGRMQTFITICLAGLTIVIFTEMLDFSGILNYPQTIVDYVVNLLFLGVFMVVFKRIFDAERNKLVENNSKIAHLNEQLSEQALDLKGTNEAIQEIRDNLEATILERTKELEEENQKLIEYSFINAHLIRAPLTNISGALKLKADNPELKEIAAGINEMDQVLKKIAEVLK